MPATPPHAHDIDPLPTPVSVVGDIHLSPAEPDVQAAFLGFLASKAQEGGTLVLLGDVFDAWLGAPQVETPTVRPVIDALRTLCAAGVRLCFQPGNRDFLFAGAPGLELEHWPDLVRTRLGSRVALLTHGDLLCTADVAYQRMRRVLRGRIGRLGVRFVPYRGRLWLGGRLRRASQHKVRTTDPWKMNIDYAEARRWLEHHDAQVLIAGHVHTGLHHRLEGEHPRDIFVLRDWERGGSVVHFDGTALSMREVRALGRG